MTTPWEGYQPRECGEHRTTGLRAWCNECQEWCYLGTPCRGCEIGPLRDVARAAIALNLENVGGWHYMRDLDALRVAVRALRGPL